MRHTTLHLYLLTVLAACLLSACAVRYASRASSEAEQSRPTDNDRLLQEAASWLGVPYRYGGDDRSGIDCSALVARIVEQAYGITLPRTTAGQRRLGVSVPREQMRPGDLMFFRTNPYGRLDHVGLYLGQGRFIHASSSSGVVISSLDGSFFRRHFVIARRYRP